ncbi:MAG: hypothetical protein AAF639_12615 [Chloroflexota bacterium]
MLDIIHNTKLNPEQRKRVDILHEKNNRAGLTDEEESELDDLIAIVDENDLKRLLAIGRLAERRGRSVPQLMDDLGLSVKYA